MREAASCPALLPLRMIGQGPSSIDCNGDFMSNRRAPRLQQNRLRPFLLSCAALVGIAFSPGIASAANCKGGGGPNVDWQGCDKSMLMLSGSDLSGANLTEADFTSTDLRGTNLTGANLEKA